MLRAIKFAARFDYVIAQETADAMRSEASWIQEANGHRLAEEFFRIVGQKNSAAGFRLLLETGLLEHMYQLIMTPLVTMVRRRFSPYCVSWK